jgi:hypothetical protein
MVTVILQLLPVFNMPVLQDFLTSADNTYKNITKVVKNAGSLKHSCKATSTF